MYDVERDYFTRHDTVFLLEDICLFLMNVGVVPRGAAQLPPLGAADTGLIGFFQD